MKLLLFLLLVLMTTSSFASVMGISTHPLNRRARVFSAEMTGYMSQRNEMGMGVRYTHETRKKQMVDFTVAGGQDSRALILGGGMDFNLLSETLHQPKVSIKPYLQMHKFEDQQFNLIGMAPSLRKGFSVEGYEVFPYLALPAGIKINNQNDNFVYYASLTMGASMPFPGDETDRLLLSLEGNKDFGASTDYLSCLVSWIWN